MCVLACLTLAGCLGNSGSPAAPAAGVRLYPGDGAISVSWNESPGVTYWAFHAQDPTLSATGNWTGLLAAGVLVNAASPTVLCGQINNPNPSTVFPEVYFTINGRTGSSPGGAGTALVGASPRPAGGPYSPWVVGNTIPGAVTALGYGAISGCGYAGRPGSGVYVAVGPSGTIYSSTVAPNVAGPLSPSQGNTTMTWARGSVPIGFNDDLVGVAAFTSNPGNPLAPGIIFVAIGATGNALRSIDGLNWQQVSLNALPSGVRLHGVASTGGSFVAVGDSGTVLLSGDGLSWTLSSNSRLATANTLNAVHCAGNTCVAVGQSGTTLWSSDRGNTWQLASFGTHDWKTIAYGSNDVNADALINPTTGAVIAGSRINTWVMSDSAGNYAFENSGGVGAWVTGPGTIASNIVAMDYVSRFLALDASGNVYASENGVYFSAVANTGVSNATAIAAGGLGYVAIGTDGRNSQNASSY